MNNPFGKISAFAIQASKTTRAAIQDGVITGKQIANDRALLRQMAMKGGIGAGIGAAAGVGTSYGTGDRHAMRDGILGGVTGGLLGAGWSGRSSISAKWKGIRDPGMMHGPNMMHGPSLLFERAEQPGGLRPGWVDKEFAAGVAREERLRNAIDAVSEAGTPRPRT